MIEENEKKKIGEISSLRDTAYTYSTCKTFEKDKEKRNI